MDTRKMSRKSFILNLFYCLIISAFGVSAGFAADQNASEALRQDAGVWIGKVQAWPHGPSSPPVEGTAIERSRLLGDAVWLVSDFEIHLGEHTSKGTAQFGYDPLLKKLVGSLAYSENPHLAVYEGDYDAATQTSTLFTDVEDPLLGRKTHRKLVSQHTSPTTKTVTSFIESAAHPGHFFKVIETVYTLEPGSVK